MSLPISLLFCIALYDFFKSVLYHCFLSDRKGIRPVKMHSSTIPKTLLLGEPALPRINDSALAVAVQGKNIWGAWTLIIWEATTAKRNLL